MHEWDTESFAWRKVSLAKDNLKALSKYTVLCGHFFLLVMVIRCLPIRAPVLAYLLMKPLDLTKLGKAVQEVCLESIATQKRINGK